MRLVRFTARTGSVFFLNPDMVESVWKQPDDATLISMENGEEYVVRGGIEVTVLKLTNGFAVPTGPEEHTT